MTDEERGLIPDTDDHDAEEEDILPAGVKELGVDEKPPPDEGDPGLARDEVHTLAEAGELEDVGGDDN